MGEKDVTANLYENGDWLNHKIPREIAKLLVRDMIKQMSDEPMRWLVIDLSRPQLEMLAEAALVEMREREHSPNQPPEIPAGLKLLGEL